MPPWELLSQWVFGGLITMVMWFIARTMMTIDKNQAEMFSRLQQIEKDFYELRGEHLACPGRRRNNGN